MTVEEGYPFVIKIINEKYSWKLFAEGKTNSMREATHNEKFQSLVKYVNSFFFKNQSINTVTVEEGYPFVIKIINEKYSWKLFAQGKKNCVREATHNETFQSLLKYFPISFFGGKIQ